MAMGKTHALSGVTVYALAVGVAYRIGVPLDPVQVALGAVVSPAAAMLPDIDHPDGTIARSLGWATRALCMSVNAIGGGHRRFTHSLAGCAILTGLTALAAAYRHTVPGAIACGVLLWVLLAAGIRLWRIRGWVDDFLALPAAAGIVLSGVDLTVLPYTVALGTVVHLAGDWPTHEPLRLGWPFTDRIFGAPRWLRFRVDGWFERKILFRGLWVALALIVSVETGALGWLVDIVARA
jgi:membrane-bound metal-dependent hydrolase YbcI (DUF457 family)